LEAEWAPRAVLEAVEEKNLLPIEGITFNFLVVLTAA
jgi:hypothetical protein